MNSITNRALALLAVASVLAPATFSAWANNLQITNLTIAVYKPEKGLAQIKFDISWANSWRYTNINHDAAWVFFKVQPGGDPNWQHAILEGSGTNPPGYVPGTAGTPIELVVPSDRMGLFVRRSGDGVGATSAQNVRAVWNFTSNSLVKTEKARIQVMAIEMVYVAEGSFKVGDGTSANIRGQFEIGTSGASFAITNEAYEITLGGGGAGSLGNNNASGMAGSVDDFKDATSRTLPAAFPKGYAAFYCMKYEITQGQYRDFLNTLTRAQQVTRTGSQTADWFAMSANAAIQNRNGIRCPSIIPVAPEPIMFGCDANSNKILNEPNDAMDRACNFLSWADGATFADWAGLRPMTELEFEKACRGPLDSVVNEYAWGSATISATSGILDGGTGMEAAIGGCCNYDVCTPDGPYRVGIYATGISTREQAGASYWGIMELSGNVWERPVTVGNATGRVFTGLHGNGELTIAAPAGNADVIAWPGTGAAGAGFRGGGWYDASVDARVSDRNYAANVAANRGISFGWRGVRAAPSGVGP